MADRFATVDEYIGSFPPEVQDILRQIRRTIHDAVPDAAEKISYQMPTLTLDDKHVVYFAAWKHHISLYPIPAGDEDFERAVAPFRAAKGTLRFPLDKPIPYALIERAATLLAAQHR